MSRRLETIADLVPEGARVADIGTDHARLLPLLVVRRRAVLAIGIDHDEPLHFARRTLAHAAPEIAARIELRRAAPGGDGLGPLQPGEVDAIVIAGMGSRSIIAILEAHPDRIPRAIVLQPLTELDELRAWLDARGFEITAERTVHERGRDRVVLAVSRHAERTAHESDREADDRDDDLDRQRRRQLP